MGGRNPALPKNPWHDDSLANTSTQWVSHGFKVVRTDFVHPRYDVLFLSSAPWAKNHPCQRAANKGGQTCRALRPGRSASSVLGASCCRWAACAMVPLKQHVQVRESKRLESTGSSRGPSIHQSGALKTILRCQCRWPFWPRGETSCWTCRFEFSLWRVRHGLLRKAST